MSINMNSSRDQPNQAQPAIPQPTQALEEAHQASGVNTVAHTNTEGLSAPALILSEEETDSCSICLDPLSLCTKIVPCGHLFHLGCIMGWFNRNSKAGCPCCRGEIKEMHYTAEDGTARVKAWVHYRAGEYEFRDSTAEAHQRALQRAIKTRAKREQEMKRYRERHELVAQMNFQMNMSQAQSSRRDEPSNYARVNRHGIDGFQVIRNGSIHNQGFPEEQTQTGLRRSNGIRRPNGYQLRAMAQWYEATRQQEELQENDGRRSRASQRREDEQEHPVMRAFNSSMEAVGNLIRRASQQRERNQEREAMLQQGGIRRGAQNVCLTQRRREELRGFIM